MVVGVRADAKPTQWGAALPQDEVIGSSLLLEMTGQSLKLLLRKITKSKSPVTGAFSPAGT